MATFQDRVEDYVGTFSDTAALTSWLTESARKLIDLIPLQKAMQWGKEATFTGASGTSVHDSRILEVFVSNRRARLVDTGLLDDFTSSTSIHYVTDRDPVYYVYNSKVYAYPTGSGTAKLHRFVYPTSIQYDDTAVADFPTELVEPVVLDVAAKAQLSLIRTIVDTISVSSFTLTYPETLVSSPGAAATIDLSTQYSAITTLFSSIGTAITTVTTYVDTNKDIELAEEKLRQVDRLLNQLAARVQEIQAKLAEYQAENSEELDTFNANLAKWQAEWAATLQTFTGKVQQEANRIQGVVSKVSNMSANFLGLRRMYYDSLRLLIGVNVEGGQVKQ